MITRENIKEGMVVRSSDGEKLGKITSIHDGSFTIEKGLFFPKEFTASFDQVTDIREGEVYLFSGKNQLVTERGEQRIPLAEEEISAQKHVERAGEVTVEKQVVTEEKQVTVPVTHEEVRVERRPVSGERAETAGRPFEKESVTVPIEEEEVEIKKRPVVREEVVVTKEREPHEETYRAETRREEAEVERKGKDETRR